MSDRPACTCDVWRRRFSDALVTSLKMAERIVLAVLPARTICILRSERRRQPLLLGGGTRRRS